MPDQPPRSRSLIDKALRAGGVAFDLIKETVRGWSGDNASQLGAALAFYTALSLAPLLVLVVVVAGTLIGSDGLQSELVNRARTAVGQDAATVFQTILQNASSSSSGLFATIISFVMLMFGASGVFGQLKSALNQVWELKPGPERGVKGIVKDRLIAFAMVFGAGVLLVSSLTLDGVLAALSATLDSEIPALSSPMMLRTAQVVKFLVSFGVFAALFAFIYKTVPDAEVAWGDVWIGGAVTSFLFTVGNLLIGLYLGRSTVGSAYGAAGSLVAFLVWVYYSAQVIFFGAEFTQIYADKYGSTIQPKEGAVRIPPASE
jgi:membrane protein